MAKGHKDKVAVITGAANGTDGPSRGGSLRTVCTLRWSISSTAPRR